MNNDIVASNLRFSTKQPYTCFYDNVVAVLALMILERMLKCQIVIIVIIIKPRLLLQHLPLS